MADPGFPRGGVPYPKGGRGHQSIIWPKFLENFMKMKKIGMGAHSKYVSADPPLNIYMLYFFPELKHDSGPYFIRMAPIDYLPVHQCQDLVLKIFCLFVLPVAGTDLFFKVLCVYVCALCIAITID